jgi:branched-chain amino acid transport system ATP-binding protein
LVEPGEIVGLFGANGAGKSTTLRAISGLVPLAQGSITFDGETLNGRTPEQTAALGIAHIPERRGIFPSLTVWQNLKMGGYAQRLPAPTLDERIDEVLALFPILRERLGRCPAASSRCSRSGAL